MKIKPFVTGLLAILCTLLGIQSLNAREKHESECPKALHSIDHKLSNLKCKIDDIESKLGCKCEKNTIPISHCDLPLTIRTSGVYCLVENVTWKSSKPAITIKAPNVVVNMGSYSINGADSNPTAIAIDTNISNIVIRDGYLLNQTQAAISIGQGANNVLLDTLTFTGQGQKALSLQPTASDIFVKDSKFLNSHATDALAFLDGVTNVFFENVLVDLWNITRPTGPDSPTGFFLVNNSEGIFYSNVLITRSDLTAGRPNFGAYFMYTNACHDVTHVKCEIEACNILPIPVPALAISPSNPTPLLNALAAGGGFLFDNSAHLNWSR